VLDVKLETLLTVVEQKNFTRAAETLSLTQPAVSHHISQIEAELGARLFVRGRGELRLTPAGETAVRYAKRMKAMYGQLLRAIGDEENRLARIRVGITHTAESNTIAEVFAKYGVSRPDVTITILTDTIKNLYAMLENYELDMAVVEGKYQGEGLNYLMLDTDQLVCVLPAEHRLARRSAVTVDELKGEPMILRLPSSATRALFEAGLTSLNESISNFSVALEVDNIATIKDLVRKGLGISILPRSACLDEIRTGRLAALPVENLGMLRETNLVYNRDFAYEGILEEVVQLYRETAHR
jgi:DNA-binding transcriptional LysR family regulator